MQKIKKLLSVLLCVAMLLSNVPMAFAAGETYAKITSETEFTTGSYVMVVSSGYAMGAYDNGSSPWVTAVQPKISGDTVVDAAGGVWTLTVDGSKVKITDANGVSLKPKASNTNGIASGDFSWSWSVADGIFTFKADAETVTLASNTTAGQAYTNKFRAYKNTTVASNTKTYLTGFSLYKLEDGGAVVPPATEPVVTEPVVTEPVVTEPVDPNGTELTIEKAIAMGVAMEHNTYTTTKYQVTGVITEVYNTQYGNMKIADEAGNILTIYGTWSADGNTRYDALEVKPVAGDTVTVLGILGQYNGTAQIKNGWIVAHTASTEPLPTEPEATEPAADTALTVEQAIALGASKAHNVYTAGKYYVTGVITEVYNTQYGNMKIADEAGNILTVYGTYDADGTNRYDAMTVQPIAGDTVTVYGIVGQYNGTPQIKNGWIVEHKAAGSEPEATEPTVEPTTEPQPTEPEATEPSVEPTVPSTGSAVLDLAYQTNRVSYATDKVVYQANGVTLTNEKASSSTNMRDNAGDNCVRLYPGSLVRVEYPGMTKLVFTCTNETQSGYAEASMAGLGKITVDGVIVTLELAAAADSIEYTVGTQHRYTQVEVFAQGGSTEPEVTEPTTEPTVEPTVEPTTEPTTEPTVEPTVEPTTEPTEPEATEPSAPATGAYEKVTSAAEFTSGTYVMMVDTGYAMGALDGTWISFVQPKVSGNAVVDAAGGVWTLTVDGNTVKITDANGVTLKPKAANTNGIASGDFSWTWAFENGTFTFTAEAETVRLAQNAQANEDWSNKFRAYKLTTLSGSYAADYHSNFELYKLADGTDPVPPTTEPQPTEPSVEPTEPSVEPTTPAAPTELTVAEAIAMGAAMEHNTYTDVKYNVTGVITEVYNTQYGNMRIADEAGNILTVYGTWSADGNTRYDALEVKPVAGDTVTIYGPVGQYNGTAQIKNGWIVAHTASTEPQPTEPEVEEPAADTALTVEQAIALGASKDHNVYTAGKYYVTGVITEVYNTQYGNMKIADEAGNILTVYGTYDADGTNRYDAMTVQPVAGDTVTVYGIVGQFNGTPQIKNGWIVEHKAAGSEPEATEPSVEPTTPSEPVVEPTTPSEPVVEPTTPSEPEPTAPVIPEGSTVITVTADKAEIYRGDEVTITVSVTGENVWSSMGYIPFTNSSIFTVLEGSVVISGAGLAEFTPDGGGVVMLNSAAAATGDVFRFTVKIADDAPFGTFKLTDVASVNNGMSTVPTFVLEENIKVVCNHQLTNFVSVDNLHHKCECSVCGEELVQEHNYEFVNGTCLDCGNRLLVQVVFKYEDGTIISENYYHFGEMPVAPETPAVPESLGDNYEFAGWDHEIAPVNGDTWYIAQFKLKYIRGDVNGDMEVNDADAMYLLRYTLFGNTRYPINQSGDMNGDGAVNDADAMYLLRFTLFGETRYPLAKG